MVAEVTRMEVGEIFFNMPLRSVYAYQHCYMVSQGVDCKYPQGKGVKTTLDELAEFTKEQEDGK